MKMLKISFINNFWSPHYILFLKLYLDIDYVDLKKISVIYFPCAMKVYMLPKESEGFKLFLHVGTKLFVENCKCSVQWTFIDKCTISKIRAAKKK